MEHTVGEMQYLPSLFPFPPSRSDSEKDLPEPVMAIVPIDFFHEYERLKKENEDLKALLPHRGKWLRTNTKPHRIYCSECLKLYIPDEGWFNRFPFLPRKFCPNCGSDNRKRVL